MVNKALRIVLYTIFTISLLFVVPFNNINADTITNSNVNINYYLESVTEVTSGNYLQTYKVDFIFDQSYLGWISSKLVGTYVSNNTLPTTTSQFTITKAIYVNGTEASTSVSFTTPNTISSGALQSLSQSIQNSNVTPLADLSTLDDILNVLTDVYNYVSIDVLDELQDIVANTSLANDYLESITKVRYYNMPVESMGYNIYLLNKYIPVNFIDYNYFQYPVFEINYQRVFYTYIYPNKPIDFIFVFSNEQNSTIASKFNMPDGVSCEFVNSFMFGKLSDSENYMRCYHVRFTTNTAKNFPCRLDSNGYFIGIYMADTDSSCNISTDFALQFGLRNEMLDNIQIIANGTNESSAASSQSDQANSQLQQDSNTLFTQEDSFKQDMNSAMQNIDTTFSLNNFGSSFMTSAQWVRTQYETLTNNTPFASLITFSLLVGLALIVIGKVYK